jgi:hypothetical protein
MIPMRVMQAPVDEVIYMVAVRDRFVAASRAVGVARAMNIWRAMVRIAGVHAKHVFVYVITMHVVQVPVVQVIDVTIMTNRRVSAVCRMLMPVISVVR